MLLKKFFYLKIEYRWYCIKRLNKKLCNSDKAKKQEIIGKIYYHKYKAENLSYQYEILVGLRDEKGFFVN